MRGTHVHVCICYIYKKTHIQMETTVEPLNNGHFVDHKFCTLYRCLLHGGYKGHVYIARYVISLIVSDAVAVSIWHKNVSKSLFNFRESLKYKFI